LNHHLPPSSWFFYVGFNMLTQEYLQSVFRYENGNLYWIGNRHGAKKTKPVGYKSSTGYVQCMLDGKHHLVHRLIYLYATGLFPTVVDHINGDPSDNRIENLRDTTPSGNQQNIRKAYSTNKSGLIGAFYSKKLGTWFSRICVNNRRIWLGTFATPELAHGAYLQAKRKLHSTCTI
jgi:hypothetical protein